MILKCSLSINNCKLAALGIQASKNLFLLVHENFTTINMLEHHPQSANASKLNIVDNAQDAYHLSIPNG